MNQNKEEKKSLKFGIIMGILFFIIGLVILFFGYKTNTNNKEKAKNYTQVDAAIVEYAETTNDDGERLYAIVAEYTAEDDNEYKIQSKVYTSKPKKIGEKVKVKYNPSKPSEAVFEKDEESFLLYFVGGIFSVVGLFIAVIFSILYKSKNTVVERY